MGKIGIIIAREYVQKIRNRWFMIMTIVGPLLIGGLMTLPVWLAMQDNKGQKILIVDETRLFQDSLKSTPNVQFVNIASTQAQGEALLTSGEYTGMLYIPMNFTAANSIILKYKKEPSRTTIEYLSKLIESKYFEMTLSANAVPDSVIKVSKVSIKIAKQRLKDDGKSIDKGYEAKVLLGIVLAVFIYVFIIIYGVQIMRGVMEEKTSRIIEVIVSSVKPFQLLMGKIIGIALVGLTQFLLWIILSMAVTSALNATVLKDVIADANLQKEQMEEVEKKGIETDFTKIKSTGTFIDVIKQRQEMADVPFGKIIICFGFYFLGGYLLYGALYAAMGSAVDSETDTQQFMLPITAPIILSFVFAQYVALNPNSDLAVWLSMIPFTAPVTMMVRMPFDPPTYQIVISMLSLVAGFVFTTWIAGRIYRTGILMYGKKTSWKEIGKWLFYKS